MLDSDSAAVLIPVAATVGAAMAVLGALGASLASAVQWLGLRAYGVQTRRWILAGAVGGAIGAAARGIHFALLSDFGPSRAAPSNMLPTITALVSVTVSLIAVLALAAAQWLVLRASVRRAFVWIPFCLLAAVVSLVVVGAITSLMIDAILAQRSLGAGLTPDALAVIALSSMVSVIIGAAIYGALTGAVLVRLLERSNIPTVYGGPTEDSAFA